jgi:hypothetical protein
MARTPRGIEVPEPPTPKGLEIYSGPTPRGLEVQPHDRNLSVSIRWAKSLGRPAGDLCTAFSLNAYLLLISNEANTQTGVVSKESKMPVVPDTCVVLPETEEHYRVRYVFLQAPVSDYRLDRVVGDNPDDGRGGYLITPRVVDRKAWEKSPLRFVFVPAAIHAVIHSNDKTVIKEFDLTRQ